LLRRLFAKHKNISKRIIPTCINRFYADYTVFLKHKSGITSNISICSNHFSTYLGKNYNITQSNFKKFSTSEINIISELVHVKKAQLNVAKKIETIESQLATIASSTGIYTKDELKEK
jgi:hypothetical protein